MTRTVEISELRPLYISMKTNGQERAKFSYTHGRIIFDVIFFIDEKPFSLLFGAKQHNLAFKLEVRQGFLVVCELPNNLYKALCKALGITFDPLNPFSVRAFLKQFPTVIPPAFDRNLTVRPHHVATYRNDIEDCKKIYFCGWRDNSIRKESVTLNNLNKTKVLLGENAYQVCKKKNLSSCWTDEPSKAIEVAIPWVM